MNEYTEVACKDGKYLINERLLRKFIESHYRSRANLKFGKNEEIDPDCSLESYQVDWKKAREWTEAQAMHKIHGTWLISLAEMGPRISELKQMQAETKKNKQLFIENIRKTQVQS